MLQKKPTAKGEDNSLKYTQISLWLIKQGFSSQDLKEMTLGKAMYLMRAAFPDDKANANGDRDATPADYRMLF